MREEEKTGVLRLRLPILIAGAFVLLILVAAFQGDPVFLPVDFGSGGGGNPAPEMTMPPEEEEPEWIPREENWLLALIAKILGITIGAIVLFYLVRQLIRFVKSRWAARELARTEGDAPVDVAVGASVPDEAVQEPVLREGIEAALEFIDDRVLPSDAIIAAWVGLEESAERAGQRRGTAETPGEFTVRVIGQRPEAANEIRDLLRLYERVRFGGYQADEQDRGHARELLQGIRKGWE